MNILEELVLSSTAPQAVAGDHLQTLLVARR